MNAFEIMKSRQSVMNLILTGKVSLLFFKSPDVSKQAKEILNFKLNAIEAYKQACINYFGDFRGCGIENAISNAEYAYIFVD